MVRSEFEIADFRRDDKRTSEAHPRGEGLGNFKNNEGKGAKRRGKKKNPGKDTVSVVEAKIIMKY